MAPVLSRCVIPKVESCVAFVQCVFAFLVGVWCGVGGVFEVCVSTATAFPIIFPLVDWLQVPGVPSVECPGWPLCG